MLFILNELIYRLLFLNIYGIVYRNFFSCKFTKKR